MWLWFCSFSRKPSTNSQTILLIIADPCHSNSNGWPPIAGYSLKNWRTLHNFTVMRKQSWTPKLHVSPNLRYLFSIYVPVDILPTFLGFLSHSIDNRRCFCANQFTTTKVLDVSSIVQWLVHNAGESGGINFNPSLYLYHWTSQSIAHKTNQSKNVP